MFVNASVVFATLSLLTSPGSIFPTARGFSTPLPVSNPRQGHYASGETSPSTIRLRGRGYRTVGGVAAKKNGEDDFLSDFLDEDLVSDFCQGTNEFWKNLVIEPVRNYVEIQPAGSTDLSTPLAKLTAPPEFPGISRPVWLTILGSVPTGLVWYGYYKFSVEEEIYHYEMRTEGKVSGCGGYGTLFPFVYAIIIGFPLSLLHIPGGAFLLQAAGAWILLGQINLYRRVNELCMEDEQMQSELELTEPPLHAWWAVLPPPLDVVVGLRQVHFLSEYWRVKRNDPKEKDVVAQDFFPFISEKKRFTLKEFFRTPRIWFWFTKDWKEVDLPFLKD